MRLVSADYLLFLMQHSLTSSCCCPRSTIPWDAPNPFRKGHTELPDDFTQLPDGVTVDGSMKPSQ